MNTYAPVVQCSTLRLMMLLICIVGLNTQSTNFSNDFDQAKTKQPVYLQPQAK